VRTIGERRETEWVGNTKTAVKEGASAERGEQMKMALKMAVGMEHNSKSPALPPTLQCQLLNGFGAFVSGGTKSI